MARQYMPCHFFYWKNFMKFVIFGVIGFVLGFSLAINIFVLAPDERRALYAEYDKEKVRHRNEGYQEGVASVPRLKTTHDVMFWMELSNNKIIDPDFICYGPLARKPMSSAEMWQRWLDGDPNIVKVVPPVIHWERLPKPHEIP
jgi:hypothetical protein